MNRLIAFTALALTFAAPALAQPAFTTADKAAIFKAAGFKPEGKNFTRCPDDPSMSKTPGAIEAADLNGDGKPEAWVREGSIYCYGNTAEAFVLLTKNAAGAWVILLDEVGVDVVEKTKHLGWPDITVGGPGMGKQPLYVFNGKSYVRR
jgi:hypothetical protein